MTSANLGELRALLAMFADAPIATLEVHPVPADLDQSQGMHLNCNSPLARQLAEIARQAGERGADGEALYRMVVPAKFASQLGGGMISSMTSKTVPGGIRGAMVGKSGIAGQASFVRVAGPGAVTVAPPLILMAIAAGVSLLAEQQRANALDKITDLLHKIRRDSLMKEVNELNGCRGPIEKATAVLLDRSDLGVQLGLDAAAKGIDTAFEAASSNLRTWQKNLEKLGAGPVEISPLLKHFGGIDKEDGEFAVQLQMSDLAIALKKRLVVVQAVAQAQADPGNPLMNFVRVLKKDQEAILDLENGIADLKRNLAQLRLDRSHGIRDGLGLTSGDVDLLLRTIYRLRDLGEDVGLRNPESDVAIDLMHKADGSVVVLPAVAA